MVMYEDFSIEHLSGAKCICARAITNQYGAADGNRHHIIQSLELEPEVS
jgi:hypothetical protein